MKRCFCYLLTLVLGSLAVGGLVFALLRTDVLTLTAATPTALFFFAATAAAGLGGLLAYLLGGLLADRTPALADAWLCCGEASAVGALGALLTALITALSTASGVGLHIGAALCCIACQTAFSSERQERFFGVAHKRFVFIRICERRPDDVVE